MVLVVDFLLSRSGIEAIWVPAFMIVVLLLATPARERPQPVGIALVLAFLTGFMLVRPLPLVPPVGIIGWLPAAPLAGLLIGLFADRPRFRLAAGLVFVIALPPLIVSGIGLAGHAGLPGRPSWTLCALIALAGMASFARLGERAGDLRAVLPLLFATAGIALVTGLYGSRLAVHALTLGTVIGAGALASHRLGLAWPRSASFAAAAAWFALLAASLFTSGLLVAGATITMLAFFIPGLVAGFTGRRKTPRLLPEILLLALMMLGVGLSL